VPGPQDGPVSASRRKKRPDAAAISALARQRALADIEEAAVLTW